MNQIIYIAVAFGIIFITGFVGGMIPTRVPETEGGKRLLSMGNALAGGIFFGAAFIHLLPDSLSFLWVSGSGEVPLAPFLFGSVGFLLVLFLEKVLLGGEDVGAMAAGKPSIYPYVLTLILSVHSLIAGTALGLEGETPDAVALLFAILAHKTFAGIALGISLYRGGIALHRHRIIVTIFALSTPIGLVIGSILSAALMNDAARLFEGVFDGIAAGTFLYVALMDIISETFEERTDRWYKFLLIVLGIGLMYSLTFLE